MSADGKVEETSVERVAQQHLSRVAGMNRTAGEVRFIKDRGSDKNEWGWGTPGPLNRQLDPDYKFDANKLEPLARTLRATLMALGHVQSAYNIFTKIKSAQISPDGALGGKGYIQKIPDMRRQFMNCSEALSSLSDTMYDELHAPHWNPVVQDQSPRERDEVQDIMTDVEEIKANPENWAEGEEKEMDREDDPGKPQKVAKMAMDRYPPIRAPRNWQPPANVSCPDHEVKARNRSFVAASMMMFKSILAALRKQGWTIGSGTVLPDEVHDEAAFTLNVTGKAGQKVDLNHQVTTLAQNVNYSVDGWFEGDDEVTEVEYSQQFDVDEFRDAMVDATCPPEKPSRIQVSWGRNLVKYPATPQGAVKFLLDFDAHVPVGTPRRASTSIDRVAARYLQGNRA